MRAVIFSYFGTLTDPGAEVSRTPRAPHRELLGVCRPRFWEALAGSFGEAGWPASRSRATRGEQDLREVTNAMLYQRRTGCQRLRRQREDSEPPVG